MKKLLLSVGLLISLLSFGLAQSLYAPKNVQRAYKNETRSQDGLPGKKYWQNRARYDISIVVNPPDKNIRGTEEITYFNNSPDTLGGLNIKLIMNLHRPGAARAVPAGAEYLSSGVVVDKFTVNGSPIKRRPEDFTETNQRMPLTKPLAPHDSVKLSINWHYEMASGESGGREGTVDATTFYLAYFYPRVAVYDDYYGWDMITYNDLFEFYNDFNDYTLKVTTPKNFIVWATGTLQNPSEVLQPEFVKRLQTSFTSDSVIHIANAREISSKNVTAQKDQNTWIWKANDITDVALGVSDHYVWDASSIIVDGITKRRASVQAAFADDAKYFHRAVKDSRTSLDFLSHQWPGVPYPFPKMTTFQGFADMEYPMMVNDSDTSNPDFGQFVQDHEIAHTYFPFYMGINESRYASMDEGWATTFELLMGIHSFGKEKAESNYKAFRVNGWSRSKSAEQDLPVITPSNELTNGYGINAYGKPSLCYLALKDMLGDESFKKCLHAFMDRWHGKHPIPWDFFNTFSNASGKNLNWFFERWFFSNDYIDLAIDNNKKVKAGYQLSVKNAGGLPIPFDVIVIYSDNSTERIHQSPSVWASNQKSTSINLNTKKVITSIKLEGGIFVDADFNNNNWIGNEK